MHDYGFCSSNNNNIALIDLNADYKVIYSYNFQSLTKQPIKEQIKIKNKDNAGTIINIPPSITRFQNLKHLVLVNCVDSIPDYICQLNKLNILGVMDNPKLTSLPECLGTMENLEFINFKNTGVSSEPKSLVDNGWSEMETGMWDKFSQDDEV
jgi:hypothetical protein